MKQKQPKTRKTRKHRRFVFVCCVLAGVVLVFGGLAAGYVLSLANLVQPPDFTGDPLIPESDLFDPEETVTETAEPTDRPRPSGGAETGTTGEPTTAETTVDPLIEAEKEQDAATGSFSILQDKQVYSILLIGTDNRGNEINGRSDSMMILSVNKRTRKIHLVSLMRALYVRIPNHGYSMLNASFSWGGAKLLLKTIRENFRIQIDDYLIINFNGFKQAINTVGGIDIDLTAAEAQYLALSYPDAGLLTGVNHLDGELALAYSRLRKIDSDYRRTGRQRTVIQALIRKLGGLNPVELDALARELLPLIKSNKSGTDLLALALDGLSYSQYPISQLMLPVDGSHKTIIVRRAQMEWYDAAKNIKKIQQFLYRD
ncbi:MAG: LCP family protein [Clostridiaceae bacterium]|nr:LCP family protein [Clostridiaceae bacterium]